MQVGGWPGTVRNGTHEFPMAIQMLEKSTEIDANYRQRASSMP
jgi:hypothetical protein